VGDPQSNVELARDGLQNWIKGDREEVIASFTEDIEVYVPPELGNAGTYRGREEFIKWVSAWEDVWDDYEMELSEVEGVGERHVIALVISRAKGSLSGIEVSNQLGWVIGIRDGRQEHLALLPDMEEARRYALERERS
jgi:ketosteroid isomerase-like protein